MLETMNIPAEVPAKQDTQITKVNKGIAANLKNKVAALMIAVGGLTGIGASTTACANDREVKVHDNVGADGGNGGSTTTNTTTTTDTTTDTDTHTNHAMPGAGRKGKQIFSFDVDDECDTEEAIDDPSLCYANFEYYEKKVNEMKACAADQTEGGCMDQAWHDTAGREKQYLADGSYEEIFKNYLKGFCVYEMDDNAAGDIYLEAGTGCIDSNDNSRDCLVAGHYKLWDGSTLKTSNDFGAAPDATFDFNTTTDKVRKPFVTCFGAENGVYIESNSGSQPMSYSPTKAKVNKSAGLEMGSIEDMQ